MSEAIATLGFDEFCELETRGQSRHELVGGRVYAMAGGTERHDLAAGLVYESLAPTARANGCRPFISNRLLRTLAGNTYYPDVMLVCGPAPHGLYETEPALVVEVLSPSTADTDRREKAVAYLSVPALDIYALVDSDRRCIEVARRQEDGAVRWDVFGRGAVFTSRHGVIDVDALFEALDAIATT
jgi:Uma2 family endonuclease